jgi:hypothetical protein
MPDRMARSRDRGDSACVNLDPHLMARQPVPTACATDPNSRPLPAWTPILRKPARAIWRLVCATPARARESAVDSVLDWGSDTVFSPREVDKCREKWAGSTGWSVPGWSRHWSTGAREREVLGSMPQGKTNARAGETHDWHVLEGARESRSCRGSPRHGRASVCGGASLIGHGVRLPSTQAAASVAAPEAGFRVLQSVDTRGDNRVLCRVRTSTAASGQFCGRGLSCLPILRIPGRAVVALPRGRVAS